MVNGSTLEALKYLVSVNAESWFVKKLWEELGEEYVLHESNSLDDLMQRVASDFKVGKRTGLIIYVNCKKEFQSEAKPVVKVLPSNIQEVSEVCRDSAWVRRFSEREERRIFEFLENAAEKTISVDEVVREIIAGEGELKDRLRKLMEKINLNTFILSVEIPGSEADVERCASLIRKIHKHLSARQLSQ
ncbi:MAG: hypothetical protein QXF56_05745 [Candidatus Micrarchaeia archaeon]